MWVQHPKLHPLLPSVLALLVPLLSAIELAAQTTRPAIASRRIVKHFDFNERPLGNYESTPMFWRRHSAPGFALFLEGQFDYQVYHAAAPSFRLELNGGSVAYEYLGGDIAVRAKSDYLVTAWIRTAGLATARAYVTACYLDRKRKPIPGTEARSALVGSPTVADASVSDASAGKARRRARMERKRPGDTPQSLLPPESAVSEWQPVSIGLPGNVPDARYIGLTLWLAQERVWNTAPRPPHSIDTEDVQGTAWFDDITVCRLPRVELSTGEGGPAFDQHAAPVLLAEVRDQDGLNLSAKLTVHSADGVLVDERQVPLQPLDSARPHAFEYKTLPVGIYRAELAVTTDGIPLVRRELSFVRMPESAAPPPAIGRGFGIVLNDLEPAVLEAQLELLTGLGVEYVKLPTWNPRSGAAPASARLGVQQYLRAASRAYIQPIAVLTDGPAGDAPGVHPLLDLFSKPVSSWQPLIAGDWSRYAGLIQIWQFGEDHDASVGCDERLSRLLPILRGEMNKLMAEPLLTTVSRVGEADALEKCGDFTALLLPWGVPVDAIDDHLKPLMGGDPRHVWITVEPPPVEAYSSELRRADLARRLVEAAWQQPAGTFLNAPWKVRRDGASARVELGEDYLLFRTVADLFGDARPVSRFNLDGHARCILFDRNGTSVLFIWDPEAPAHGREYVLPLGQSARHLNLMGLPLPLGYAGSQRTVRVTAEPTCIVDAPTWPIEFRRHFALQPGIVEARLEPTEHQIVFRNTWPQPISGLLRLTAPAGWEIRPSRIPFSLRPGEEFRQTVSLRLPISTSAELTPLVGEFELDADRRYQFAVPAWFDVGLKDLAIDTFSYHSGDRFVIRLMVTNRLQRPLRFEGHLLAPGRERLGGLVTTLLPNQPVTKIFALDHPADLAGRSVRLTLKEIEGPRVWNRAIIVP